MARLNKWETKHLKNGEHYARQIEAIYQAAVRDAAAIGASIPDFSPDKPFSFSDYPSTKARIEKLTKTLKSSVTTVILDGIDTEWALANDKNSELCDTVFGKYAGKLTEGQQRRYYSTNEAARRAFAQRKTAGLNLSDRVWRYTDQFKSEIEMGLDLGLRDGVSADEMSRQLRQYLRQPDKLFRRVSDEHGQLHLSKQAAAYHPGAGVYRSSYKNARRLAATETNLAYRTSDHTRWQQLDFVVGIEIKLSNNHTLGGVSFTDICDQLAGRYPKDFKFTGWHPHCRCQAVSILKTPEEMAADNERIMNGEPLNGESVNKVSDVPGKFKEWLTDNEDRVKRAKSLPYFMQDNPSTLKTHTPEIHNILVQRAVADAKLAAPDFQRQVEAIARKFDAAVSPVNLKSIESTWRKINSDDDMHIGKVRDLVRNTIIVKNTNDIGSVVAEIQKKFSISVGENGRPRIKPQSTPMGYTGMLVNVQLKGIQGEVQINIPQMIYAKDESAKFLLPKDIFDDIARKSGLKCGLGHKYYEEWRLPTTTPKRKRELEELSRAYYDAIRKVKL